MDVQQTDDAGSFAELAGPYLRADPFRTSVIATHLEGVRRGSRRQEADDRWFVVVDGGDVAGVAMHTPPHNLFISGMPPGAASALAASLAGSRRKLPGVTGELSSVRAFVQAWSRTTGQPSTQLAAMRMYLLGRLEFPIGVPGEARLAGEGDLALVLGGLEQFRAEAEPEAPAPTRDRVRQRVLDEQIWLWQDQGAAVSMAGHSAAAGGVARVGPVFTRADRRRRGYGSAVTARATQAALDAGARDVVLYTDLANPTSNSIYQRLGYRPHHDAESRSFA